MAMERNMVQNMAENPRTMACLLGRIIMLVSVLTPMANRKNMMPNTAAVSSVTMLLAGNREFPMMQSCPNTEGPNIMPP